MKMGIVPATKILASDARGFYFEAYLCGEKNTPIPLGGLQGLAALFATIRDIPEFSKIPRLSTIIEPSNNILISTVQFAEDVSIFIFLKQSIQHVYYSFRNVFFLFRFIKLKIRL